MREREREREGERGSCWEWGWIASTSSVSLYSAHRRRRPPSNSRAPPPPLRPAGRSARVTEAEAALNLLSAELERDQGLVATAREARKLAAYDLAKVRGPATPGTGRGRCLPQPRRLCCEPFPRIFSSPSSSRDSEGPLADETPRHCAPAPPHARKHPRGCNPTAVPQTQRGRQRQGSVRRHPAPTRSPASRRTGAHRTRGEGGAGGGPRGPQRNEGPARGAAARPPGRQEARPARRQAPPQGGACPPPPPPSPLHSWRPSTPPPPSRHATPCRKGRAPWCSFALLVGLS